MKIFALSLLAATLFTASLPAHADVGPYRVQKEYAKIVYDFSVDGGAVGAHASGVTLPQGILVSNILVYVNTPFTGGAGFSVGLGCSSTNDLFAYHDLSSIAADQYYAATLTATSFGSGVSVLNFNAPAATSNNGKSTAADCTLTTNVATGAVTAGKFTAFVEYFKK